MNRLLLPTRASLDRRDFLRAMFFSAGAVGSASWLAACGGNSVPLGGTSGVMGRGRFADLGPLRDPDENGVRTPEGFSTRVVAINGERPQPNGMSIAGPMGGGVGNRPWHLFPDGGGVIARPNGGWIYVSNSEVPGAGSIGFLFPPLAPITNTLEQLTPGLGGAGVLVFDPDGTIVDSYGILNNTTFNCAGCITPWGTWLSCEEFPNGQVWETDPFGVNAAVARPTLGFFSHEAIAIDAASRVFYLTEDLPDGRFWRWLPDASDWPAGADRPALQNGRLQVLAVRGDGIAATLDRPQPVEWVDAINVDQPQDLHRIEGTTAFDGGEGVWFFNGFVYFSTKGDERIWCYDTVGQTLEVIYDLATAEAPNDILSGVDNITITPQGDILVAEDGGDMQVVVILPDRTLKPLLQIVGQDASEIAGISFTPDGKRMYFTSDRGGRAPGGGYGLGLGMLYELQLP